MKIIISDGERLRERMQNFPWAKKFLRSKILAVGVLNDNSIIAACGIRSGLNIMTVYVKSGYRGRGIGRLVFDKAFDAARKRGLNFVTGTVPFTAMGSRTMRIASKHQARLITCIKRLDRCYYCHTLTVKGYLMYMFLLMTSSIAKGPLLALIMRPLYKRTT